MQPNPFFNQYKPDYAFNPVTHLYKGVNGNYGQSGVAAQGKGNHHADTPDEYAVEKESDDCFAAGTQGKVRGVQKGVLRHKDSR